MHLIILNVTRRGAAINFSQFLSPFLTLQLREHLAKGQRTLAGEGMSQIVRSLLELLQRRSYYSGDLLFSTEILRNVTDTFKRATYIPAPDDVQVSRALSHNPYKRCGLRNTLATPANVLKCRRSIFYCMRCA